MRARTSRLPSGVSKTRADDGTVLDEQVARTPLGTGLDAAVEQPAQQTRDERLPGDGHLVDAVDIRVEAGTGLGVEADVAEVLRERGDAGRTSRRARQ